MPDTARLRPDGDSRFSMEMLLPSLPGHHALPGTSRWLRVLLLLPGAGRTGLELTDKPAAPPLPRMLDVAPTGGKKNNPKNTRAGGFERLEGASWAKRKNIPGRSGNVQGEMQPGGKISWDLPDGIQNRDSAAPGVNSSWALSREVPGGSSPFPAPVDGFLLGQTPRWSSGPNSWARTLWSSWRGCNS